MKNVFFGKLLSAVTASAMAFSFIIGAPFDFGVTVEANAEDYNPSVFAYATAEHLGDSTTFAPDPVNGVGNNIAEIYFGEKDDNPVSWYILGGDSSVSGNNMMLFATTKLGSG